MFEPEAGTGPMDRSGSQGEPQTTRIDKRSRTRRGDERPGDRFRRSGSVEKEKQQGSLQRRPQLHHRSNQQNQAPMASSMRTPEDRYRRRFAEPSQLLRRPPAS